MKINLGCGTKKLKGYINCDISPEVKPDKIINLEKKLPFKDNSTGVVVANHVLEHVNNFVPLMHELHRICKKRAKLKIKVPFYSYVSFYSDPTHVRFFTPFTFHHFANEELKHEVKSPGGMFRIRKNTINFGIGASSKLNWLMNPIINLNKKIYCRYFAWILPAAEIEFELEVIK